MTPREVSVLRDRVTRLMLAHDLVRLGAAPRLARCVYCGHRLAARHRIACHRHLDLLEVDPKYAAPVPHPYRVPLAVVA